MKPETRRVVKTMGAAVAGAAAGYVAGALTAPAPGRETRRKIGRKIEEEAKDVTGKARSTVNSARQKIAEALRPPEGSHEDAGSQEA